LTDRDRLKAQIAAAFSAVERPANWALAGSTEGFEPALVIEDFKDKADWRSLDATFLDQAPQGYASALSFLSDEAFRYFLPAYLIADLDGRLRRVDPSFPLTYGLDDEMKDRRVNERRYGDRTWMDAKRHQFSVFKPKEAAAIMAYLEFKLVSNQYERPRIEQAIRNYWRGRSAAE
jgi:hypothetical protein